MSITIEIFKDDTPQSDELEAYVRKLACPRCSILVYNNSNTDSKAEAEAIADKYGIKSWPAVALDGKVVSSEQLKDGKVSEIVRRLFHK